MQDHNDWYKFGVPPDKVEELRIDLSELSPAEKDREHAGIQNAPTLARGSKAKAAKPLMPIRRAGSPAGFPAADWPAVPAHH